MIIAQQQTVSILMDRVGSNIRSVAIRSKNEIFCDEKVILFDYLMPHGQITNEI